MRWKACLAGAVAVGLIGCSSAVERMNREGVEALKLSDLGLAERRFRESLALDEGDVFALNNLGTIFELRGEYAAAASWYQRAVETGSDATTQVNGAELEVVELARLSLARVTRIGDLERRRQARDPR